MKKMFIMLAVMFCFGASLHAQQWYFDGISSENEMTRASTRLNFESFVLADPIQLERFMEALKDSGPDYWVRFYMEQMERFKEGKGMAVIAQNDYYKFIDYFRGLSPETEAVSFSLLLVRAEEAGEPYSTKLFAERDKQIRTELVRQGLWSEEGTEPSSEIDMERTYFNFNEILENMKEAALKGIPLETAIKNNPYIYCKGNVLALLTAGIEAKTTAVAEDYVSKARSIISISHVVNEDILSLAEKGLSMRLYKLFMKRAGSNMWIYNELDDKEAFKDALADQDYRAAEYAVHDAVLSTSLYFLFGNNGKSEGNGKVKTIADSILLFGTPENEYKDGLFSLATRIDDFGNEQIKRNLDSIKILVLCNNDQITTSKGQKKGIIEFLTEDYSVIGRDGNASSLAMELYAFGSLNENSFKEENLPVMDDSEELNKIIKLEDITTDKLSKGLEVFNKLKSSMVLVK